MLLINSLAKLALGSDPARRSHVLLAWQAVGVSLMAVAIFGVGAVLGLVSWLGWTAIACVNGLGVVLFAFIVRAGLDQRWRLSEFGVIQIGYTLVSHGLAYVAAPALQGAVLMMSPLALLFGAFLGNPRRCDALGLLGVFVYAVAVAVVIAGLPTTTGIEQQLLNLAFVGLLLPSTAKFAGILGSIRRRARRQNLELAAAVERIRASASVDELTGLPNRRTVLDRVTAATAECDRHGTPFFVGMLDLDHFKRINDLHGHAAGDSVLRAFASAATVALRRNDFLGRWGGEEFILVVASGDLAGAQVAVERIRGALDRSELWLQTPHWKVTFSAGLGRSRAGETVEQFMARVDLALYRAKSLGRDRTVLVEDPCPDLLTADRDDSLTCEVGAASG